MRRSRRVIYRYVAVVSLPGRGQGWRDLVETLRHPEDVTRANIPTAESSDLIRRDEEDAKPRLI